MIIPLTELVFLQINCLTLFIIIIICVFSYLCIYEFMYFLFFFLVLFNVIVVDLVLDDTSFMCAFMLLYFCVPYVFE